LKVSGLVERPKALSLDDLKKMGNAELIAGFECSGNDVPCKGSPATANGQAFL
jgi:DMSO/TMAO reductase YedYZ molybdopterin-dependent catalytic subunit